MILRFLAYPVVLTRVIYILCVSCTHRNGASAIAAPSSLKDSDFFLRGPTYGLRPQQRFKNHKDTLSAESLFSNDNQDESLRSTYTALLDSIGVMQSHFFEVSQGSWPAAIDWTAAVMGIQVSATLTAMTEDHEPMRLHSKMDEAYSLENLINRYFTQIAAFYFGENAFSLRTQAFDDMLWVVLGWLESIKFINLHSSLHYGQPSTESSNFNASNWYARQFIPSFAHRAHLFYDLASRGWDDTLCGGGMVWNRYLAPYKNAITNQLFISASVSMYLYFPGDSNPSPFEVRKSGARGMPPAKAHDERYLENAIRGYDWLKSSGMRNEKGLYVDGFHIQGWRGGTGGSNGTSECDIRDETVYTYNQGVLLSGLKGLWEATGSLKYLEDGHELIRNVIAATGWEQRDGHLRWQWAGLGRNGVLEEACDWSGMCSQDAQTFKGIFFHHFTAFCSPLPVKEDDDDRPWLGDDGPHTLHRQSCDGYVDWVSRNANAAYVTRNRHGEFGGWWHRAAMRTCNDRDCEVVGIEGPESEGTDYRNIGVPKDAIWRLQIDDDPYEATEDLSSKHRWPDMNNDKDMTMEEQVHQKDINDRGRGRTVETQSGGVAVIRAAWKLISSRSKS